MLGLTQSNWLWTTSECDDFEITSRVMVPPHSLHVCVNGSSHEMAWWSSANDQSKTSGPSAFTLTRLSLELEPGACAGWQESATVCQETA
jgi:hypothetical protein